MQKTTNTKAVSATPVNAATPRETGKPYTSTMTVTPPTHYWGNIEPSCVAVATGVFSTRTKHLSAAMLATRAMISIEEHWAVDANTVTTRAIGNCGISTTIRAPRSNWTARTNGWAVATAIRLRWTSEWWPPRPAWRVTKKTTPMKVVSAPTANDATTPRPGVRSSQEAAVCRASGAEEILRPDQLLFRAQSRAE